MALGRSVLIWSTNVADTSYAATLRDANYWERDRRASKVVARIEAKEGSFVAQISFESVEAKSVFPALPDARQWCSARITREIIRVKQQDGRVSDNGSTVVQTSFR